MLSCKSDFVATELCAKSDGLYTKMKDLDTGVPPPVPWALGTEEGERHLPPLPEVPRPDRRRAKKGAWLLAGRLSRQPQTTSDRRDVRASWR